MSGNKGFLSTHVLDTSLGIPAQGINILLYRVSGNSHKKIAEMETNEDGRTDTPILPPDRFKIGEYELIFQAGAYFDRLGIQTDEIKFLDQIPIRFGISDADAHYHVPLLLSPYGYSTYRGS